MKKKIFKTTQDVFIQKDLFKDLNGRIEKFCLNSKVLFFVEPYYYLKYNKEILELKKYSLNFINVVIIKNYSEKFLNVVENYMDESVSLLLVLGEDNSFNFVKTLTIKNNTNTIFLSEKLNCNTIFSRFFHKNAEKQLIFHETLPASCVIIKEQEEKSNLFLANMCSYFANLVFYETENFLSTIFLNGKKIAFYFDKNNSLINNVIVNELNFQKNKINNNLLDEILFYSNIKNCMENKILISLIVLKLYRGFISKISFNNYNFKNYVESLSLFEDYSNSVVFNYLTAKLPKNEKVCYQIITARKFLLKNLDKSIEKIRLYCDYIKLINAEKFEKMRKSISINNILQGIKTTAKITKNETFLKIIDEFDLLI